MRLTSRFIYSEKRLKEKIITKFGETEDIEDIINWLKSFNAINDKKNKEFFVAHLKEKGYGVRYIKAALKRRGFDPELDSYVNDETYIRKWYEKRFKNFTKPLSYKEVGKVYRYLLSKGFTQEEIVNFLKKEGIYEG